MWWSRITAFLKKACPAGQRVRLFSECVADIAGHPSDEYDPERESERGGQRRCTRSGALFDCGAVRHRRITQTPHTSRNGDSRPRSKHLKSWQRNRQILLSAILRKEGKNAFPGSSDVLV